MSMERRGHTATRFVRWSRVDCRWRQLLRGGYLSAAEIFDPASGTFSVVGSMAIGRADHAAVKLADGKVLHHRRAHGALGQQIRRKFSIQPLGTFSSGPTMSVARASHSATLFADGRVFVAGGDANGSAEIFDSGSFSAVGANLIYCSCKAFSGVAAGWSSVGCWWT